MIPLLRMYVLKNDWDQAEKVKPTLLFQMSRVVKVTIAINV